jgi:hypothetical protein
MTRHYQPITASRAPSIIRDRKLEEKHQAKQKISN